MKPYRATNPMAGAIPGDTIGQRINALRQHLGMTRKTFSERTKLTEAQIGRLERGGQSTRGDDPTISSIARNCGVQPVWLYAGSNAPRNLWPDWWNRDAG